MRRWERDLADHLVLPMTMQSDEPSKEAFAELKRKFPSLPIEEAARSAQLDPMLPARERDG